MTALVAGGGIAGLTLALALARRGISSRIVERAPRLEEAGAGVQLSPNASRVLDALGLGQALDAVSTRPRAVEIVDALTGRLLKRLPLGASAESRWGAPYRVVHRADLQAVLLTAVEASGSAEITLGAEIREIAETADGVALDVLTSAGVARIEGGWLAGCDGLRSVVRPAIGLPTAAAQTGLKAFRTSSPAAALSSAFDPTCVTVRLGPGAHLVIYPVRSGREANLVLIGDLAAPSPQNLVRGWEPAARALVAAGTHWTEWPLFDRTPDARIYRGKIALLGDAAHAALPSLAQGAAFAIEDAAVLARLVDGRGVAALTAYQEARLTRVARLQREARRQIAIDHMAGLAAAARNTALVLAPNGALIRGLDWMYGWRDAD